MNTDAIESMVRDVLSRMNSLQDGATPAPAAPTNDTARQPKVSDYPLATRRSTQAELLAIADDLEHRYQARLCAAFVREAAGLYVERKKLKGDD